MAYIVTFAILGIAAALYLIFAPRRKTAFKVSKTPQKVGPLALTGVIEDSATKVVPFSQALDLNTLKASTAATSARLWAIAFGANPGEALGAEYLEARQAVMSALLDEKLNPKHLPRRPQLMPKLMQAVSDINASREKVSRIIAQDPVLTADVLKLSNSPLYRLTAAPVESIQRAVVICGEDGLRVLLATALVQPIFRATDKNFPRFINMLWARSEQAARISEIYASDVCRTDRFEAQLLALLSALGPLVVYRAVLEFYAKTKGTEPNPGVCAALVAEFGPGMARRVAAYWETSPRLLAALEESSEESGLTSALYVGEFLASLTLVEIEDSLTSDARKAQELAAGLPETLTAHINERLVAKAAQAKALAQVSADEIAREQKATRPSSSPAVRSLSGGSKPAVYVKARVGLARSAATALANGEAKGAGARTPTQSRAQASHIRAASRSSNTSSRTAQTA